MGGETIDAWKIAYKHQFGSDPDEDIKEYASEVEDWRINWQSGYDAGEEWAIAMVAEAEEEAEEEVGDEESNGAPQGGGDD